MMPPIGGRYNEAVLGRWGRGAAVMLFAWSCWLTLGAQARADEQIDVGSTPIVNVQLGHGTLTVQTWDRPQVQIVTDGAMNVRHLNPTMVDPNVPRQLNIESQSIGTPQGSVTLPAEPFVLPQLQGSLHDSVIARGNGNTVVTIPRSSALVIAHVRNGRLNVNDYRGVFVAHVHNGPIYLNRVAGTGFVESLRGQVTANDSTFDRLRARTASGNLLFNNCTSHQIEATSTFGSIVYDNGSFEPGLARFESENGNVALGVRGAAQIGAHSDSGRVVSSFPNGTQLRGGPNTAQATLQGGGPVVTATSHSGSVYLYNGAVSAHPSVQAQMRGVLPSGPARGPVQAARPVPVFRVPVRARRHQPPVGAPRPRQFAPRGAPVHQFNPPPPPQQQQLPPPAPQERRGRHHRQQPPN